MPSISPCISGRLSGSLTGLQTHSCRTSPCTLPIVPQGGNSTITTSRFTENSVSPKQLQC
ncbi:hypothetical protein DPMN_120347 [Dreissena polymorpha]|uniref:Uncharacterized protein n=1 Tax=Dreissena polymorpha TaxID=45954 RepID=A0A9D4GNT0_DREPO|nr:hypothetical protein DPMN_120347 [Dreissena polymorpha]